MKRILFLAALLAGCGPTTSGPNSVSRSTDDSLDPWLYKDRVTGCEYITTRNEHGLSPRIAADGKTHMGCKGGQP